MKSLIWGFILATFASGAFAQETIQYTEKDVRCLAQNIYHEAGSEPFEGKVAVAQVSLNRAEDPRYPNSICGVISQKTVIQGTTICQFSWYCTAKKNITPVANEMYQESLAVARMVLGGFRIPKMDDALYFHNKTVKPNWGKIKVATIGNHIFYKDKQ